MAERIVYARAHPEKVRLTERYYYDQEISRNSTTKSGQEPDGQIEIVVPYDGYDYFTRHAGHDVEQQLEEDPAGDRVDALIGHLLLADYSWTDLGHLLDLDDHWGSVPLCVPVVSSELDSAEQLRDDQHSCRITYQYVPFWPEVIPLAISIETRDEDVSDLPAQDQFEDEESRQLRVLFEKIFGQINRRRTLRLIAKVWLTIPSTCVPAGGHPLIKCMWLVWPTITSVHALDLKVDGVRTKPADTVIYNPEKGRVEWTNIPLELEPEEESSESSPHTYCSAPMCLLIEQPGELYQQNMLAGQVEVELPGCLLSGLKVHVTDAPAGRRKRSSRRWPHT